MTCPNGSKVPVNLELQMSSFSGYEGETSTYLGTQCHGVMWPETAVLPAAWPICPPTVAGKVSIKNTCGEHRARWAVSAMHQQRHASCSHVA